MSNMEIPFNSTIVLHTSRYLFDNFGFHTVGVDRICKEANLSKMTFYKYFKSKEKLIETCLNFNQETLKSEVSSLIERYPRFTVLEILEKIFFLHVKLNGNYHLIFKAIFEIEKLYPEAFKVVVNYRDWLIKTLVNFLSKIIGSYSVEKSNLFLYLIDGSIIQLLGSSNFNDIEILWNKFSEKYYYNI